MPIKGVSDVVRIPRLGKIRLGEKVQGERSVYPKATDYFVVPDVLKPILGEKPREIDIMFPTDDPEGFAPQYLKLYGTAYGLQCKGDGEVCERLVDKVTGVPVWHGERETATPKVLQKVEAVCNQQECDMFMKKQCRRNMNLMFLIPDAPGLGAYQIDTSSFHSMVNINSMVKLIKMCSVRLHMVPLTLVLEPREVTPEGKKKKTIYTLNLQLGKNPDGSQMRMADLARLADMPVRYALSPPLDDEPPDDLYPVEVLEGRTVDEDGVIQDPPAPRPSPQDSRPTAQTEKKRGRPKGLPLPAHETPTGKVPPIQEPTELDMHLMAEPLGQGNWDSWVVPKMNELFGTTDYERLDVPQCKLLEASVKAEIERRRPQQDLAEGVPPMETAPPAAAGLLKELERNPPPERLGKLPPGRPDPAKMDEIERPQLKRMLGHILMDKRGMNKDQAVAWLQKHFNVSTRDDMTVDQLRDAVKFTFQVDDTEDGLPF